MRTKEQFYEAADKIRSLGFRVWVPTDSVDRGYYYGYYSDGKSVASFSLGWFFGVRWSTVNAPGSKGVGTGFSCEDEGVPVNELTAERLRYGRNYEITVNGKTYKGILYEDCRITEVYKKSLHAYGIRHADDDWSEPASIATGYPMVNFLGTFITNKALPIKEETDIEDWNELN